MNPGTCRGVTSPQKAPSYATKGKIMFMPVLCPVCGKGVATTPERAALLGGLHPECWRQVQQEPRLGQQEASDDRLRRA